MRAIHFWSLQFLLTAPLAGAGAAELKVTLEDAQLAPATCWSPSVRPRHSFAGGAQTPAALPRRAARHRW